VFSKNEKPIVENFYNHLGVYENKHLKLSWGNDYIEAMFDTCFDDFSDDDETDEFTSFVFEVYKVVGTPPIELSEANFCIINYHNFPKKIEIV
jgi:hypothetical protein